MKKILFIVSTLGRTGPTNQLYNLIYYLDKTKFSVTLLTLSPEPLDTRWSDFSDLGLDIRTLGLSRIGGVLHGKRELKRLIVSVAPDLVHTQGIRADSLMASMWTKLPWVMTVRNFALEDYLSNFGRWKGLLIARKHFSVMKRCQHVIACSKTIAQKLANVGVTSTPIQNGSQLRYDIEYINEEFTDLPRPIFISVGNLNSIKNMNMINTAFKESRYEKSGSLLILGDGGEKENLQKNRGTNVHLLGNVNNVEAYLHHADFYVSASSSEGLPNTVLEALAAGLPCLLSDIPSHREIFEECPEAVVIFPLDEGVSPLIKAIDKATTQFSDDAKTAALHVAQNVFSAQQMSCKYQEYYAKALDR